MHLLRFRDQFITEIGMCNTDNGLCALPGGQAFEIYLAILRYNIVNTGTGIGGNRSGRQCGNDTAL